MLRRKTVFVVGAGASKEFGLPLGHELGAQIARALDIKFKHGHERISGDGSIYDAIRRHLPAVQERDPNPWLHACWRIRDAMPHHNSIDNLIDNHAGDDKVALCGKLAIVKALLESEKASKLYFSPLNTKNEIDFRKVEGSWLSILFRMLQEGVHRTKADQVFNNAAIITFNYDRCIEHFLYRVLQHAYGVPDAEAARIVCAAPIRHVYGTVGDLPWQNPKCVPFGGVGDADLLRCADSLRTYGEQKAETAEIHEIRKLMAEAEIIVFLGFGYLGTNVDLLTSPGKDAKLILGSATGFSRFNAARIAEQVGRWLHSQGYARDDIIIDPDATAASLLIDYGRAFS